MSGSRLVSSLQLCRVIVLMSLMASMILAGHKDWKIASKAQIAKHKVECSWMHFVQTVITEA